MIVALGQEFRSRMFLYRLILAYPVNAHDRYM